MDVRVGPIPRGKSCVETFIGDDRVDIHTYKPSTRPGNGILLLFHGKGRKADVMLNAARRIADRQGINLVAPHLPRENFPNWRYHRAGTFREGTILPRREWTMPLVTELADWSRQALNAPTVPVYMYGHSAGGQFLSRIAAYGTTETEAQRIVIANPSVHVSPSLDEPVPYGFGKGFKARRGERLLKAYLCQPITIYVGSEDTAEKHLVNNAAARRQGPHRLARAQNIYRTGRRLARERNWEFNWQIVIVENVGHSSREMLRAPGILTALGLTTEE